MKSIIWIVVVFLFGGMFSTEAQNSFPNTIRADSLSGFESPPATLEDISWIQGHWKGEAFGGIAEESWSPPLGGSMMCVFKLVVNDEVKFYEIVTISEEQETLMLRLKHFHKDLKGWEEKNETIDFPLVKVTPGKMFFDGFTFERISENEMNIYVIMGEEGKQQEIRFNYRKVLSDSIKTKAKGDMGESEFLGLRTTIYLVGDLNKAKAWYAKVFKTDPYFDEPYYVGFNIGGYELGLQPEENPTTDKVETVRTYWGVNDIHSVYQWLIDSGASENEQPFSVGGELMVASVKDPWGNLIGIIYNPKFRVSE